MTNTHETPASGHSLYSPSSAARYIRCPGSVALSEDRPDSTSKYALEGTAAHELAEMVLTNKVPNAAEMLNEYIAWEERGEPVSWKVTEDMVEHVQNYVDSIIERMEEFEMLPNVKEVTLHVEEKVDFSAVIGIPNQSGTADIVIQVEFNDDTVLLSVEDLKYGMGVKVDAEGNEQLMTYGCGVMDAYELVGYDVVKVNLVIHQIRLKHISEHTYEAQDMRHFAQKLKTQGQIAERQRELLREGTPPEKLILNPGEKQCRFCKAKAICPAAREAVAGTVFGERDVATSDEFEDLDEEQCAVDHTIDLTQEYNDEETANKWLASCMKKIDFIQDWCKAIRAETYARLMDGTEIPGYKLVKGKRGARSWVDANEAEETLKSMRIKQDDMYTKKLVSPTQTEKLLKQNPRKWNKLQDLITQSEGKPAVAPESDKRKALDLSPVSEDFDDLTAEDT